jgi:flagellar protein FlaJ
MLVLPIALVRYYQMVKIKALEENFPQFIRDLVESIRSGMTLPQAIESISKNDYGNLSPLVKKLNAQLDWGIPFDKAFLKFSRNTNSKLIGRTTLTIIESHRFGGNLTDIFEAISSTSLEIERLREERKLYINSQLMTGYVIFFVFLIVIIGLQKFLIPTLADISDEGLTEEVEEKDLAAEYTSIFRNLIILQGLFAGLVIGKMSEGQLAGGIKHSLFLIIIGVLIFSIAGFI